MKFQGHGTHVGRTSGAPCPPATASGAFRCGATKKNTQRNTLGLTPRLRWQDNHHDSVRWDREKGGVQPPKMPVGDQLHAANAALCSQTEGRCNLNPNPPNAKRSLLALVDSTQPSLLSQEP